MFSPFLAVVSAARPSEVLLTNAAIRRIFRNEDFLVGDGLPASDLGRFLRLGDAALNILQPTTLLQRILRLHVDVLFRMHDSKNTPSLELSFVNNRQMLIDRNFTSRAAAVGGSGQPEQSGKNEREWEDE